MKEYTVVEIDMRNDFSDDPRAALPVPGTLAMVGKMRILEYYSRCVIDVFDNHHNDDPVSQEEFKKFLPHCIVGTWGHKRIGGLCDYYQMKNAEDHTHKTGTFIQVRWPKNTYDAWEGMKGEDPERFVELDDMKEWEKAFYKEIGRDEILVVGGVVTGICVKAFIEGAIKRGMSKRIIVISDCVANLDLPLIPSTESLFKDWSHQGVVITSFDAFVKQYIMKD